MNRYIPNTGYSVWAIKAIMSLAFSRFNPCAGYV